MKISLCNCGDCGDAYKAALRFAEQNFQMRDTQCHIWNYAVAAALSGIALDLMVITTHKMLTEGKLEVGSNDPEDAAAGIALHNSEGIEKQMVAVLFEEPELNNARADFICKALDYEEGREFAAEGPNEETLRNIGFVTPNKNGLAELLARIIRDSTASKPH